METSAARASWNKYIVSNPKYMRPAEVATLRGDPHKAEMAFGWKATTPFYVWVNRMVQNDIQLLRHRGR